MSYVSRADLGGQLNQGRVVPEPVHEKFHASWEPRVLSLTVAMGATGCWNIDMSRAARETLPNYRDLNYYQIWFYALQRLLEQQQLVHADEIDQVSMLHPARSGVRVLLAANVAAALAKGSPTERTADAPARFAVGQRVRMRSSQVSHHTRLPAYVRGKQGVIERVHGAYVFPDTNSRGLGEQPQWLYTVVFEECEVWGNLAQPQGLKVSVDAWEPYLEPFLVPTS